jgi:saccharopine dehydrogenase-like protein
MVRIPRILIAGGYGVFGRLLAAELLQTTSADIVIAGRDLEKANAACRGLGPSAPGRIEPMRIDLARSGELRRAAEGCDAVVCTAGPFQTLSPTLVGEAVEAGSHWVDIADATGWVLDLLADRRLDERARVGDVAVGTGLSTLPTLSGVLASFLIEQVPQARAATVVLSIGNRNRKGTAAVASALMGRMRDPVRVMTPFGRRTAYRIDSPDEWLLANEGLEATCRVALESSLARRVVMLARSRSARAHSSDTVRRAFVLSRTSSLWHHGTLGGCVQVDLVDERGRRAAAAFIGTDQRMAILPAAIVLQQLVERSDRHNGVTRPADWLPTADWIAELHRRGLRTLWRDPGR